MSSFETCLKSNYSQDTSQHRKLGLEEEERSFSKYVLDFSDCSVPIILPRTLYMGFLSTSSWSFCSNTIGDPASPVHHSSTSGTAPFQ